MLLRYTWDGAVQECVVKVIRESAEELRSTSNDCDENMVEVHRIG